jgi:hypothetical protein
MPMAAHRHAKTHHPLLVRERYTSKYALGCSMFRRALTVSTAVSTRRFHSPFHRRCFHCRFHRSMRKRRVAGAADRLEQILRTAGDVEKTRTMKTPRCRGPLALMIGGASAVGAQVVYSKRRTEQPGRMGHLQRYRAADDFSVASPPQLTRPVLGTAVVGDLHRSSGRSEDAGGVPD